jgi:biofilm protein TabA
MILCCIRDFQRYVCLNSRFGALSKALDPDALKRLLPGRHDVVGDELYVMASPEAATRPTAMLEVHRRYIDVHVVLNGQEIIGWSPLSALASPDKPFDLEHDFGCFRDPHASAHPLVAGQLMVCFPEDAHAPLLGSGSLVQKCVFKVLVDD